MIVHQLIDNMAQQQNDKLARSLLDPSGREVLWPVVFAGVKNVVRANNLNNDTLTCIKGWLKSNDSQLHIPLLALTVLHTMSLNGTTVVRNQMATPKLFQRLEKQLARPQGPQVATALVQILVDWTYLFGQEDLGQRSQGLLDQPRYRQMAAGCSPSPAVQSMQEELQLGVPPVAPTRGEDFIRWMYRGASGPAPQAMGAPGLAAPSLVPPTGGSGGAAAASPMTVQSGALPGGAPPAITTQAVPELCKRMQADSERLFSALSSCRTAARVGRQSELTAAMDAGYREAERCSQWRRRVQDYTQKCDDPLGLSSVLTATDVINGALQAWQQFTGQEVYDMLRISVTPMPPELRRPRASASGPAAAAATKPAPGRGTDLADLLGMGHHTASASAPAGVAGAAAVTAAAAAATNQQAAAGGGGNPFGSAGAFGTVGNSGTSATSRPTTQTGASSQLPTPSGNPFALGQQSGGADAGAGAGPGKPGSNWDPFAPSPSPPPAQQQPQQAAAPAPAGTAVRPGPLPDSSFATASAVGVTGSAGPWAFPLQDSLGPSWTSGSYSVPFSPNLSSPLPSGGLFSPSGASAVSAASTTSTSSAPAGGAGPAVHVPASSPRRLPSGVSHTQPFQELVAHASAPHPPAAAAAASAGAGGAAASRPASVTSAPGSSHPASQLPNGQPQQLYTAVDGTAAVGASSSSFSRHGTGTGSVSLTNGGGAASAPTLDWEPEFERLTSELQSLWAAAGASSPAAATSAQERGGAGTGTKTGAGAESALLPFVLSRVKNMCKALAAQHARQVAALAGTRTVPYSPSSAHSPSVPSEGSAMAEHNRGGGGGGGIAGSMKLREVASASAIAGGGGVGGYGGQGNGVAAAVGPLAGSWVGFGAGTDRPPAVGPLQQHLLHHPHHHQQQHQHQHQYHSPYPPQVPPPAQQQHQHQQRPNGATANPFSSATSRDAPSLI